MDQFYANTGIPDEIYSGTTDSTVYTPTNCCTDLEFNGEKFPILGTTRIFLPDKTSLVIHKVSPYGDRIVVHMLPNMSKADDVAAILVDLEGHLHLISDYERNAQPHGNYCEHNPKKFSILKKVLQLDQLDDLEKGC
jgi:hypothetical protein